MAASRETKKRPMWVRQRDECVVMLDDAFSRYEKAILNMTVVGLAYKDQPKANLSRALKPYCECVVDARDGVSSAILFMVIAMSGFRREIIKEIDAIQARKKRKGRR